MGHEPVAVLQDCRQSKFVYSLFVCGKFIHNRIDMCDNLS